MPKSVPQPATDRASSLLHRHWLPAWWAARGAVRACVPLAEYLRYRAAQYTLALSRRGLQLPLEVSLEGSTLQLRDVAPDRTGGARAQASAEEAGSSWESELARRHGPEALATLAGERAKASHLGEQLEEARADLAARRQALATALAAGTAAAAGDRAASAHLKPAVPSLAWALISMVLVAVFTLAEAWQLALPFLDGAGIDSSALGAEFRRAPSAVLLGLGFAMTCTVALVWLAHLALSFGKRALDDLAAERRPYTNALLSGVAGSLALLFAGLLGTMRHATADAGLSLTAAASGGNGASTSTWLFVLATALLPFAMAAFWGAARTSLARRAELAQAAHDFEAVLRTREEERHRLEERLQLAQQALADLRAERTGAEVAVRKLGWLGEEAARQTAEARWLDGEELARAREALRAVLETDRYAYSKAAGRSGDRRLLDGREAVVLYTPGRAPPAASLAQEAA